MLSFVIAPGVGRKRFLQQRLKRLADRPRPGRPP